MTDLEQWARIEAEAWTRAHEDDAHVRCEHVFHADVTVQLAMMFSRHAREQCEDASRDLVIAHQRAARAFEFLERTTVTLEQAIRLQAMGRR